MTATLETMKIYQDHMILPRQLVIVFDYGAPVTVLAENDKFEHIKQLLESGQTHNIAEEVDRALEIRKHTKGKFTLVNGTIMIGDELLPSALSEKLLEFVDNRVDTTPLENFWANLKDNPAASARQDLFAYLEANRAPLTVDGCFVAYKRVRDDWWDSHTGRTHQNLPGKTITMDRAKVDPNRENTCSAGLHVAAWDYASTFSGSRTLLVKVNPRDVVAVPPDYNQQKMRVCQYLVLGETESPYDRDIFEEAVIDDTPTSELDLDEIEVEDDYESYDDYDDYYDDEDEDYDY